VQYDDDSNSQFSFVEMAVTRRITGHGLDAMESELRCSRYMAAAGLSRQHGDIISSMSVGT
jgi:hypothetical protein